MRGKGRQMWLIALTALVAAARKDSQAAARWLRSEQRAAPPPRPHQGTERGSTLRTHRALITTAIGVLAMLSATAPAAAAPARGAGQATAGRAAAGAAVVVTTTTSRFGRVLVTGSGRSLYTFTGDGFPFSRTGTPQLAWRALN